MAASDIVDVDHVQCGVDIGGDSTIQELDDRAPGRSGSRIALANGKRRMNEHDGKPTRACPQHFVLCEVLGALVVPEEVLEMHDRLLRSQTAVLGHTDGPDRARVDDSTALRAFRGPENIHRAADVHVVEEVGVSGPESIHGGEMEDRGNPVDRRVDNRWITDVSDDPLDGESFEVVVGALRLHEHSHAITLADQRANRRGSYEPRRARDEHRIRIGMIVHS
jgi:hypothetical protein